MTVYRQSPWQTDRRHKIASVPYLRPTAPTWIHEASSAGRRTAALLTSVASACHPLPLPLAPSHPASLLTLPRPPAPCPLPPRPLAPSPPPFPAAAGARV